jgi:hypothetical protein
MVVYLHEALDKRLRELTGLPAVAPILRENTSQSTAQTRGTALAKEGLSYETAHANNDDWVCRRRADGL